MRALVATACWIATVIIALRTGQTVVAKSASVRLYKDLVNDSWTRWLEALYEQGARRWGYLVPDEPVERRELRDLCAPMLAFENHYLRLYRDYLLAQLDHGAASKRLAVQRLSTAIYPDDETLATLQALTQDADHDVRGAATTAPHRVREVRSRH